MAEIRWEDVVAIHVESDLVCMDCIAEDEREAASLDELMTTNERDRHDERAFYCDRCKRRI
jgi:hypothetical protein